MFARTGGRGAAQPEKKVVDLKADVMYPIEFRDTSAVCLVGNVAFYHSGAVITCDSAVRYSEKHMECFGNVLINKNDTYVYGVDAKQILPTILSPTEIMDGAVISGNCVSACDKNPTYVHQNNPVTYDLLEEHGKTLNFVCQIITNENVKEFTEISVALCSDGIISFNRMSVLTSRKSSAKEPAKPPRIIRYGLPENVIPNANNTPIPLKIIYFLYFQFGKYPTTFAPSAAPSPMTKRAGPSNASFNPASGSFACRKKRTSVDTEPINAFTIIMLLAFRLFFMKCQLSVMTF